MFRRWKIKWNNEFNERVLKLFQEKELDRIYNSNTLPNSYWKKINIPRPELPLRPFMSTFLGLVLLMILLVIPVLWLIKF